MFSVNAVILSFLPLICLSLLLSCYFWRPRKTVSLHNFRRSARSRCARTFSSDFFSLVAKRENGRGNFSFLFNNPLPCCLGPLFISRLAFRSGLSEFNRDQCVVARQYCEIVISSAVEVIPSKTKFCCCTNKPWGWGNFRRVIACT